MPWFASPDDTHCDPGAFRAGAEALGVFYAARSWMTAQLSDGRIDRATAVGLARGLGCRKPDVILTRLVTSELWRVLPDGLFEDVRYLELNDTRARVLEKKAMKKNRQGAWLDRRTGKERSDRDASIDASQDASIDGSRDASKDAASQTPAPAQTQTQKENPEARVRGAAQAPARAPARGGFSEGSETRTEAPAPTKPIAGARAGRRGPIAPGHDTLPAPGHQEPVNGHLGAKSQTETPTPLRGPLPRPAGADGATEASAIDEADKPEPTAEQKRLDRLAGYAAHYSAGVASVTGAPHVVAQPHELDKFALITTRYAQRDGKPLKGPELSEWLRALGAEYATATQHAAQYQRGYAPSKCLEWLGAGRPKGPRSNGTPSAAGGAGWARL